MIKPKLLDLHITENCNLTCESCSDFNNHGFTSMLSLEDGERWMSLWNKRIQPKKFIILGGEPTLHKDLIPFLELARHMWSNSEVVLTTNGFFIHQHEGLDKVLKENNITLGVSLHHKSKEYARRLRPNILLLKEWRKSGVRLNITPYPEKWAKIYHGYGDNILPYEDNDPESSWNCCINKGCYQLRNGHIYKCPPLAYLPLMAESYRISDKWDPYLKYTPLTSECSDEELFEFFNRKSESVCAMCPANMEFYDADTLKSPLMSVKETKAYYESKSIH